MTLFDTSELAALRTEMVGAARATTAAVRPVVAHGAVNIKKDWRDRWSGLAHARALPFAISYDLHTVNSVVVAEIGPDKDRPQGALGNLIEFGSVNNAPLPGGAPALDAEAAGFEAAVANVATGLL